MPICFLKVNPYEAVVKEPTNSPFLKIGSPKHKNVLISLTKKILSIRKRKLHIGIFIHLPMAMDLCLHCDDFRQSRTYKVAS